MRLKSLLSGSLCFLIGLPILASEIRTNSLVIHNRPSWLKKNQIEKITERIESKLEWKIRRIPLYFHASEKAFKSAHRLGPRPAAVSIKSPQKTEIHISPRVSEKNIHRILGHELVHIIFYQKYKGSIPRWLEEGFANFYSRKEKVNYTWLSKQKKINDITKMDHPYKPSGIPIGVHYKTSQALVEMLDQRCDLSNLLRLSVQRKLTDYISRTCQIKEINQAYTQHLEEKSKK